ncbi:oligosaccharide flippase family protein [Azotobacter chroococcum]|uniref:oligosaccharide flippase family protein n=1 Tax=Azotobacter chroococcum TaxID=353 RepID=UPI000B5FEEDF|nr:oligosaccharide flippase family protein [Azotobacter chroococcum]ASL29064.1 hypothetical protein ACG10_22555 [Azotobacter chroococcum]
MSNLKFVGGRQSRADLFFVYMAYALRYLYLLLLIPFYGRVLGVEGYGLVLAAMSLMNMTWLFVNWGFSTAGMRAMATASPAEYAGLFGEHVMARMILSALAFVGGAIAIVLSPVLSTHPVAGLAAVTLGIVSAFNLGWYFTGSGRPRSSVKLEVMGFAISLLLILTLVRNKDDSDLVLISLLCSGTIALAVAHWWIRHEISQPPLELKSSLALIQSSSTIFLYSGSSVLLVASSTYLLTLLSTQAEVGAFGAAERLVAVGLSVLGPAGQIFVPRITAMFVQDACAAYGLVRKAMAFLLGMGFCGLLCSLFLGHWIVPLIFGAGFEGSVSVLQYLAFVFPLNAANLVLSSYVLIPLHKESMLAKAALAGAAVNLFCAVPLGIAYGGLGMAVARISGELIVFLALSYSCWKMGILARIFNYQENGLSK